MNLLKTSLPNQLANEVCGTAASTKTYENGVYTVTCNSNSETKFDIRKWVNASYGQIVVNPYDKMYISCFVKSNLTNCQLGFASAHPTDIHTQSPCDWTRVEGIFTENANGNSNIIIEAKKSSGNFSIGDVFYVKNWIVIDLTELYGAGQEPPTAQAFKQDFPLDYYPYRATSTPALVTANNAPITADISSMLPSGIGCVDLGSLNWMLGNASENRFYSTSITDIAYSGTLDNIIGTMCSNNFIVATRNTVTGGGNRISYHINGTGDILLTVVSSSFAGKTASEVKTLLDGILLFYKKA